MKYLPLVRQTIEYAYNLLKFGTFDISNIPISILMSKAIFLEYFYQLSIFIKFKYILSIFSFWDQFGPSN